MKFLKFNGSLINVDSIEQVEIMSEFGEVGEFVETWYVYLILNSTAVIKEGHNTYQEMIDRFDEIENKLEII